MAHRSSRTVAAILVVLFVLLLTWSVYNFISDVRAPSTTTSQKVGSYVATANGTFVAVLLPNHLCNCTEIAGGNATLFPAITRWINVSLGTTVRTSEPGTISVLDLFTVTLATSVWSKIIYSSVNRTSVVNGAVLPVLNPYTLNVSAVQDSVALIDGQLDYQASYYWLTLSSTVFGSIVVPSGSGSFSVGQTGNFSFQQGTQQSTIFAGFQGHSDDGNLVGATQSDGALPLYVYLLPMFAAVALAGSIWLYASLSSGPEDGDEEPIPDLEELIAPYEEVIAETATVPDPAATAVIDRWEDLVKISDTLGKPILRPMTGRPGSSQRAFYVLDGDIGYLYRYRPAPSGTPSTLAAAPRPRISAEDLPGGLAGTLERVRAAAARIEALPPADPRFPRALARFRRIRALLQARRWVDAERALGELERLLAGPDS